MQTIALIPTLISLAMLNLTTAAPLISPVIATLSPRGEEFPMMQLCLRSPPPYICSLATHVYHSIPDGQRKLALSVFRHDCSLAGHWEDLPLDDAGRAHVDFYSQ